MTIMAADLFCGAGGTSTGMVNALKAIGYQVSDIDLLAINHWNLAIATHSTNHPWARHLCENLDNVNPRDVVPGGYLDLMVASPECTHHSRARGGKPISDQSRASAWHVLRWAEALFIENILIENVPEFMTWGPLDRAGGVVQNLKGKTFLAFIDALRSLGYNVSYQILNCADYGDPTTRKRLFIMAKRSKMAIFPEPTHAKSGSKDMFGERKPWKPARDVIDWSLESASIFTRKKALSPNTMRRIMKGLQKFSGLPFVVTCNHGPDENRTYPILEPMPAITSVDAWGIVQPYLVKYHGDSYEGGERVGSVEDPFPTVATSNQFALVEPFIIQMDMGGTLHGIEEPMNAITSADARALVEPFIIKYYGTGQPTSIAEPLDTITAKDRFGLVLPLVDGRRVVIDIKFRMLQPHELAAAMSFPKEYSFSGNREQKVKQIGNAVPGRTAEALVTALFM